MKRLTNLSYLMQESLIMLHKFRGKTRLTWWWCVCVCGGGGGGNARGQMTLEETLRKETRLDAELTPTPFHFNRLKTDKRFIL